MNKQEIEKAINYMQNMDLSVFIDKDEACGVVDFITELLQQQLTNGWIPVSEGLPENEERVLICADKKMHNGKVIQIRTIAMHEDGTIHTDDSGFSWEDHDFEYDEETDDYIIPEGWWEQSMYCEEFGAVDDFVTHWMPLPESYYKEVSNE